MDYFEYQFEIVPFVQGSDLLISLLEETAFESFVAENNKLLAYIPSENDDEETVKKIIASESLINYQVSFSKTLIPGRNWNAEWESNFNPIEVNKSCLIRAPFHKSNENYTFQIIISPKMSFGTGHHETTFLMANQLFKEIIQDKKILDMGCGTGVLGIIAEKIGATEVTAIDIEESAVYNTLENCILNKCCGIHVEKGGAELIKEEKFNLILANINKNVLKKDAPYYEHALMEGGVLLISGFFSLDIPELIEHFEKNNLHFNSEENKNGWAMLRFTK